MNETVTYSVPGNRRRTPASFVRRAWRYIVDRPLV